MAARLSECPSVHCRATQPRQRDTVPSEQQKAGLMGGARICTYCGCLYLQHGPTKVVRGYIEGEKWTPANA